eukprot:g10263.t1
MANQQNNSVKYTTCICMVGGLPGAGKTSLVQALKSTSPGVSNKAPTVFYISFDRVYNLAQQGPFDANAWRDSRKCIFQKVEQLVSCLESRKSLSDKALLQGVDIFSIPETAFSTSSSSVENIILLDDNFYYKSMRHVFFRIAQEKQICFGQLFLKASVRTCMERNRLRTGVEKVPETVIERMNEIFEWPTSWVHICIDSTLLNLSEETSVIGVFQQLFFMTIEAGPVPVKLELSAEDYAKREADRQTTRKNRIHQIDNLSKKITGQIIKEAIKENMNGISEHLKTKAMKQLTKRMQNGKKDLLKIFRENSVKELVSPLDNCETINDYLMTYLTDIYNTWKAYIRALKINDNLSSIIINLEKTTFKEITTGDLNALESVILKVKSASFESETFRSQAADAGLCDTLRKIIHIFSSVFIGSSSFSTNITEFDGLRILKQTFLTYRNVCANAPRSQQVAAKSGALTIALQFVLAMMKVRRDDFEKDAGEQWQIMGIAAVKSALQFIGNAIVMCAANQTIVWDFCISEKCLSEMMVVGARMDRGVFGTVVMIVYNCLCKCKASLADYDQDHRDRLDILVKTPKNTVLSTILTHTVTEKNDDPAFVWVEVFFETILEVGAFSAAFEATKPTVDYPMQISMEQRVLLAFLLRYCGISTSVDSQVQSNAYANSGDSSVSVEMIRNIKPEDVSTLIEFLNNLIVNEAASAINKEKIDTWKAFLVDAISGSLSLFAELAVFGSDFAREIIANDTKLLRFVILCLANPAKIGLDELSSQSMPSKFRISPVLCLRVLANLFANSMLARDEVRKIGAIPVILSLAHLDAKQPLLREWGIMAIRNLCANNKHNQDFIQNLKVERR